MMCKKANRAKIKPVGGNLPKPSFRNASLAGKTVPQARMLRTIKQKIQKKI